MSGRKKNSVLIVDDDRMSISSLKNILSNKYIIYAATDGQDAIETILEHMPDIILLDVLMPEMNGYEVINALKSFNKTRDIPVIFITGIDDFHIEEKGLSLGAADYIQKPFTPVNVMLRIQNQLKLLERLRQQSLMTDIARNFLTDTFTVSLFSDTLRMVGEFMGISTMLLYKHDNNKNEFICQNEWLNPELDTYTRIGDKFALNEKIISAVTGKQSGSEKTLYIHSSNPLFRDFIELRRQHFDNFIATPVFIKGKICAFLVFSKVDAEWKWSESELHLAVLVSSIFSGALERDAMERQYSIIENSANLVLYITTGADIEFVNPAVTAVTGYTSVELISAGLSLIFGENALDDIKKEYIPKAMRGETVLFESKIQRKDGSHRVLMISIVQTGKNNLGMITSDLTEIRRLESGLISAKDRAEYLSHAKSEFLSRVSHEMRTPMNTIMGLLQIFEYSDIPEKMKKSCSLMNEAAKTLLGMIDDMLDISDMEYEAFGLSESVFDFNLMIRDILHIIDNKAVRKRQMLNCEIDPDIPAWLSGDEKRLKQIIINILANAVKFTPEGGDIFFNVRLLFNDDSEIITLQFEVTDNGIGIAAEHQEKLFLMFEQADGSNEREHGGIGIGLPLSKRIIEMMDGKIWIESDLGKGTKVYFTCKLSKTN